MLTRWDIKECFHYDGSDENKWQLQVNRLTMQVGVSLRQLEERVPKPKADFVLRQLRDNAIQIGGDLWVLDQFVVLFLLLEIQEGQPIVELQRAVTAARTQALLHIGALCEEHRLHAQQFLKEVEDRLAKLDGRPGEGMRWS